IAGTLFASKSATYTIQVFSSPKADPSGFGEGQKLLTSFASSTDGDGNASLNLTLPFDLPPGSAIAATATDSSGNSSEFSSDAVAQGVTDLGVSTRATPAPV